MLLHSLPSDTIFHQNIVMNIIDKNDETLREICNRFNVNIKFDPK